MQQTFSLVELPYVHDLSAKDLVEIQLDAATNLNCSIHFCDEISHGIFGPELVIIPAGMFEMGSSSKEFGHAPEECPQHYVQIREPYAMSRYTITAEQFAQFEQASGWQWRTDLIHARGEFPVINIDSTQAGMYADWLSEQTGQRYRLPAEAEWEYAARAGSMSAFAFGDQISCREVHFNPAFPYEDRQQKKFGWFLPKCMPLTRPLMAGSLPPNLWGLHEMHGNIWEFTSSAWTNSHARQLTAVGDDDAKYSDWLVTKGGSWFDAAVKSRSAARMPRLRNELDVNLGFRLIREVDPEN